MLFCTSACLPDAILLISALITGILVCSPPPTSQSAIQSSIRYTRNSILNQKMSGATQIESSSTAPVAENGGEKKLKPCCACPETRKKRDECIVEQGEVKCTQYIEAHKECLRKLGFNI